MIASSATAKSPTRHLVALTLRHGGRLATFDRGIADVVPRAVRPEQVLELLS